MRKCLTMTSPKHNISATIEGNAVDIIYVGELEIHTVLTYHCANYSVWPGSLLIVLYLALTAKTLDTPCSIMIHFYNALKFKQEGITLQC